MSGGNGSEDSIKGEQGRVEADVPETSTGHEPVRVLDLQPAEWTTVIGNLNITTGRKASNLKKLAKSAVIELGTPSDKEKNWRRLFQKSQVCIYRKIVIYFFSSHISRFVQIFQTSMEYSSSILFENESISNAVLTSSDLNANLYTPWVSGSLSQRRENNHTTMEAGTNYTSLVKAKWPIGTFRISKDHILRDTAVKTLATPTGDDEKPDKKPETKYFRVNKNFIIRFQVLLLEFNTIQTNAEISGEEKKRALSDLTSRVKDFFSDFGDVLPLSVEIGLASYRTEAKVATSQQTIDEVKKMAQAEISVPIDPGLGVSTGLGMGKEQLESSNAESGQRKEQLEWFSIAGSAPSDSNDPLSLIEHRNSFNSWSAMEFDDFIPVVELLPQAIKQKIMSPEYDSDPDFFTVFHQFHRGQLFSKWDTDDERDGEEESFSLTSYFQGDNTTLCVGYRPLNGNQKDLRIILGQFESHSPVSLRPHVKCLRLHLKLKKANDLLGHEIAEKLLGHMPNKFRFVFVSLEVVTDENRGGVDGIPMPGNRANEKLFLYKRANRPFFARSITVADMEKLESSGLERFLFWVARLRGEEYDNIHRSFYVLRSVATGEYLDASDYRLPCIRDVQQKFKITCASGPLRGFVLGHAKTMGFGGTRWVMVQKDADSEFLWTVERNWRPATDFFRSDYVFSCVHEGDHLCLDEKIPGGNGYVKMVNRHEEIHPDEEIHPGGDMSPWNLIIDTPKNENTGNDSDSFFIVTKESFLRAYPDRKGDHRKPKSCWVKALNREANELTESSQFSMAKSRLPGILWRFEKIE